MWGQAYHENPKVFVENCITTIINKLLRRIFINNCLPLKLYVKFITAMALRAMLF